jgi:hypothetical protein
MTLDQRQEMLIKEGVPIKMEFVFVFTFNALFLVLRFFLDTVR